MMPSTPKPAFEAPRFHPWIAAFLAAILVLAAFVHPARGQDQGLRITQYAHEVWTADEGLPQNSVNAVVQTSDGYIWLGTPGGLTRFDGVQFHTLTRKDGLPGDEVSVLTPAGDGTLWLGTNAGGIAHLVDGAIEPFPANAAIQNSLVRTIYEDRDGIIWIGTIDSGVFRWDGLTLQSYTVKLGGNLVTSIHQSADGAMWFGTDKGLVRVEGAGSTPDITHYTKADGLPGETVSVVHEDPQGRLWLGTSGGLSRMTSDGFENFTTADGLCGDNVSVVQTDPSGALWIGTLGGGLCRLAAGEFDAFSVRDGLPNDRVKAIYVDREDNIWVGTARGGLNQFRVAKFKHISVAEGMSHRVTFTVMEVAPGVTAVGTEGGGVSFITEDGIRNVTSADGLASDDVYAIERDHRGRIWIGMYGGGICRLAGLDARVPEACFGTDDGLPSSNVYSLEEDSDGRMWVGTLSGLVVIENEEVSTPELASGLVDVPVMGIQEDFDHDLWFATYGSGIYRAKVDRNVLSAGDDPVVRLPKLERYSTENGLGSDIILTLHLRRDGAMWAGIQNGGLCRLEEEEALCTAAAAGMPADVLQILEDDEDRFWLGSMTGVYRVDVRGVEAVLHGDADSVTSRHFGRADGLRVDDMNGGSQPSAWKASDGRLWFATSEGVALIDPGRAQTNDVPPTVLIECVHVNDVHIDYQPEPQKGVLLEPGSRDVVFYYTGLSYTASRNVRFQYMLEGYDDDWVDAGERREAYYTNLPPGKYRFVVKAANNDGIWSDRGAEITITIKPFFYQTNWFFLLCLLAVVGIGFLVHRMRIRKLRTNERELARQVEEATFDLRREKDRSEAAKRVIEGQAEELKELNDSLEQKVQHQFRLLVDERRRYESDLIDAKERAEASDRLKTAILQNLNHEFRTPLTAILGFSEIIASEGQDELNSFANEIRNGGKRLLRTLDALLEFSRLESDQDLAEMEPVDLALSTALVVRRFEETAGQKKLNLTLDLSHPALAIVDASAFEQVVWNLVDNAIKFTEEGEVLVTVGLDEDSVYVRVRDTGIGIGDKFLERMYDAFTQESNGYNRTFEGVGLGLTITRRLVEQMGGLVDVETAPKLGTTFTVAFPAVSAEEVAAD